MAYFINYSFHTIKYWCDKQLSEAQKYGEVIDMTPVEVLDDMTSEDIDKICYDALEQILKYDNPTVMVQANYVSTYRLVNLLKKHNIKVVAAYSKRGEIDYSGETGVTMTEKKFVFEKYIEY